MSTLFLFCGTLRCKLIKLALAVVPACSCLVILSSKGPVPAAQMEQLMAEGCKDNPAVLTVTESMGCALHKAPESLSKLPHSASFSLCPTIVSRYAQINRHTWEVYFRIYGYCKTSRNSFKLSKICSQGVTSKVLEEGPGTPAVFLAVLWRFVCFPPGGGSR